MSRSRPSVPGSGRSLRVITNTTLFPVTCIGFSFSAGDCVGFGGAHYRGAANAAVSLWTGSTGSSIDGFHSLALSILILCSASTPVIRGGSRMRRHARTVLCGGRLAMIVPTATAKKLSLELSLPAAMSICDVPAELLRRGAAARDGGREVGFRL